MTLDCYLPSTADCLECYYGDRNCVQPEGIFLTNQINSNAHLSHPIEFTKLMIVGGYDGNEANANNSYYRTAETIDFAVS